MSKTFRIFLNIETSLYLNDLGGKKVACDRNFIFVPVKVSS